MCSNGSQTGALELLHLGISATCAEMYVHTSRLPPPQWILCCDALLCTFAVSLRQGPSYIVANEPFENEITYLL
jgi:hypothetical protein